MHKKLLFIVGLIIVSSQTLQSQQYKVEVNLRLDTSESWDITTGSNYYIGITGLSFQAPGNNIPNVNANCNEVTGYTISERNTMSTSCDLEWDGPLPSFVNTYFEGGGFNSISRTGYGSLPLSSGGSFSVTHSKSYGSPISPCSNYSSWDSNTSTNGAQGGDYTSLTFLTYRFIPRNGQVAQLVGGQQVTDFTLNTPFQLELTSGLPATWQYTLDDSSTINDDFGWVSFPFGVQTMLGLGVTLNDLPPSGKVRFRGVVCSSNGVYTNNIVSFDVVGEAPNLVGGVVNPFPPTCHYSGAGSNGLDGGFTATFDRDLVINEKLGFIVLSEGPTNIFTTQIESGEVRNSDLNNRTFNYFPSYEDMPPGRYVFKWMTGPDQPGDLNIDVVGKTSPPFEIPNPEPVVINSFTPNNVTCEGEANGSISLIMVQGGSPPYRYVLIDSGNNAIEYSSNSIPNLVEGQYALNVLDANGCISNTENIEIQAQSSKPILIPDSSEENQYNEAPFGTAFINLGTIQGEIATTSYEWTRSPDNGFGTVITRNISNLLPGDYSVVITTSGCVSDSYPFTISEPPSLSVTINPNGEINCEGDTATLQATASNGTFSGYSYEWFQGTINDVLLSETSSSLIASQGEYTVRVTDSGGNEDTDTFTLNYLDSTSGTIITQPLTVSEENITPVLCKGESTGRISLNISGGTGTYRVFWDNQFSEGPQDNTNLATGDHTYEVFDGNNCSVTGGPIFIDEPSDKPGITINLQSDVTTNGGSNGRITVSVQGGTPTFTYAWKKDDNDFIGSSETDLQNISAGVYELTVRDNNGVPNSCEVIEIIAINEPGPLQINDPAATVLDVACFGESTGRIDASYEGTTPFEFVWFNEAGAELKRSPEEFIENLPAGIYSYTINDASNAGPIPSGNIEITQPTTALGATFVLTEVTCFGGNDGTITVSASGGTAPLQYQISGGLAVQLTPGSFTNVEAGNYTINVTDANGCSIPVPLDVELIAPTQIIFDDANAVTPVSSPGGSDGSISVTVLGGAQPYFYSWTGPGTLTPINDTPPNTTTISNLTEGVYTLEVSNKASFDIDGCYFTRQYSVSEQDAFSIQSFTGTPTCFNQSNGSLMATIVATGTVTFNWTLEDNTIVATETTNLRSISTQGLAAGNYYLEIVDSGNQRVQSNLFEIVELAEVSATVFPIATCLGSDTGSITFSNPTGSLSDTYSYSIDDGLTFQANPIFEDLAAGNYTPRVSAMENPNCDFIAPGVTVTTSPGIFWDEPNTQITRASGNGASDGAIAPAFIGGTLPYTYLWSNNATNPTITGLFAGTYSVTVTDAASCFITQNFEVTAVGPLTISTIIPTDVVCKDEANGSISTTVTGEGTITYLWTLANGDPVPVSNGVTGPNITGILAGNYILTATDDNTNVSTTAIVIGEPATAVTITNITPTDVTCFGGNNGALEIQAAGGTGPYTYSLNGGTFQTSPIFNDLLATSYTVRIQDVNSCEFIEPTPVLILEPQELNLIINEQIPVTAANETNGAIFITAEGGSDNYTFEWSGPNGFTSTEEDISNLAAGNYIVTITDATDAGCILISQQIAITEPGVMIANLNQTVLLECSGDDFAEITANVQGGVAPFSYQWFQVNNGNNTPLDENNNIIGNLSAGNYFLSVTDANSTTIDTNPISITAPTQLNITIDGTTNVNCPGQLTGAINITVSGGTPPYQYFWSNSATVADISGLDAGEYTIDVEDAAGCITQNRATITAPDDAIQIADATVENVSVYQALDGSISLAISGGLTPYTYVWTRLSDNSNAGNLATISNLAADLYSVSISDANGCTVTDTYEVTQPDIVEDIIVQPSCSADSDGSITVSVNQGNGTFTYLWNNGATENNINNLAAGTYTVTVTGFENGPLTRTYLLVKPVPLEVNLGVDRVLCADQTLELDATVDDETANYSWSSANGFASSEPNVEITQSGNYTVTVQSQTGCTAQGTIFVDISTDEINAEFAVSSQIFVGENAVAVDISYPLPEGVEWIVPIGAKVVNQNKDAVELSFAEAGEYEITIITSRGDCIAQKTKKILVVAKDGLITEEDSKNGQKLVEEFIVYPNPTNGKFTTDINMTERGDVSVKVFSFTNNAMMASKKDRGELSYSIPFDLSGLPAGVYAVLLETPYGNTLRKVILK